jgi:hypothetical protein
MHFIDAIGPLQAFMSAIGIAADSHDVTLMLFRLPTLP